MKKLSLVSAAVLTTFLVPVVQAEDVVIKDFAAALSPNGKMITYYSYRGEKSPDIFVAKADGSDEKRLTINEDYADIEPAWSTNSKTVYYAAGKTQKSLNVFSISVNGGKPQQHTFTEQDKGIKGMSVANDGKHLVYSRAAANGGYEIVLAALNGGKNGRVEVLVPADNEKQRNTGPSWQPGGSQIVFTSNRSDRTDSDIYAYDMKTEKLSRITDLADSVMFAKWSGDGKSITFSTNLGNANNDVYSVNADGGKLMNLTKDGTKSQYFSSTSGDGKTLLYDSGDWESGFKIFAMDINGENKRQLSQRQ